MLKADIDLMRAGYRCEIERLRPNYFVTHNFDHPSGKSGSVGTLTRRRPYKPDTVLERVSRFYDRMFCEIYGEEWRAELGAGRILYGFLEGEGFNPHLHVTARLDPRPARWLEMHGKVAWRELSSCGQLHFEIVESAVAVADYCTKRLTNPRAFDHVLVF